MIENRSTILGNIVTQTVGLKDMNIVLKLLAVGVIFVHSAESCPPARFGPKCRFACHCLDGVDCDVITGACPNECAAGWDGNTCQRENVAFNRRVKQKEGKHSEDSSLAVDDVMGTCSFTKPSVPGWWMVELDPPTRVETIRIVSGPLTNIKNWSIYVGMDSTIFSMTLCATIGIHGGGATVKCDVAVLGKYVMVVNKAGPVELCDFQIYVCTKFWFGSLCENMCRCADDAEVCDIETGACTSGCSEGWSGEACQTGCQNAYGPDCKTPCGHCEAGACNHVTGECTNGCKEGWNGTFCTQKCDDRRYGKNCAFRCGHCHGNRSCDRRTGKCGGGCEHGYTGDLCAKKCDHWFYGEGCKLRCGNCESNTSCDPLTGTCTGGCREGWAGAFCTQGCAKGTHGKNCSLKCNNCIHGDCDVKTGLCRSGCSPGYRGADCKNTCPVGHFGQNCSGTCTNCLVQNQRACDSTTGRCLHGCRPGYSGTHCRESCPWGYYGLGCQRCGVCRPGETCDLVTGICPNGCGPGFYGDLCTMSEGFTDEDGPQLKIFLGTSITLVGGIMLVVVTCLVMAWQREHLVEVTKETVECTKDEICFRDQNGRVASDEEIIEYV